MKKTITILTVLIFTNLISYSQKLFDQNSVAHFSAGFTISTTVNGLWVKTPKDRIMVGVWSGLVAGSIKELHDSGRNGGIFQVTDVLSTATGGFLGAILINRVTRPSKRLKKAKICRF